MIRINLLAEGRRPVVARQPKLPSFKVGDMDLASLGLIVLIVVGLIVALSHNFLLGRKLERTKTDVAAAQREVDELAPIIKEVEEFRAKKAELERKVQIVSDLKANQLGPVRIMDYVSRAMPELLWLKRMDVKPNTIVLAGEAFNTNAVANFIENLDLVQEFQEPILKDTAQRGQVYTFTIEFNYAFGTRDESSEAGGELAG